MLSNRQATSTFFLRCGNNLYPNQFAKVPGFSLQAMFRPDLGCEVNSQPTYVSQPHRLLVSFGETLMPPRRKVLLCFCLFASLTALGTGPVGTASNSATEAPAGFNTPSFNSAASIHNGLVEPPGDTFARDQQVYEQNENVVQGLAPVYNPFLCHLSSESEIAGQPVRSPTSGFCTRTQMAIS